MASPSLQSSMARQSTWPCISPPVLWNSSSSHRRIHNSVPSRLLGYPYCRNKKGPVADADLKTPIIRGPPIPSSHQVFLLRCRRYSFLGVSPQIGVIILRTPILIISMQNPTSINRILSPPFRDFSSPRWRYGIPHFIAPWLLRPYQPAGITCMCHSRSYHQLSANTPRYARRRNMQNASCYTSHCNDDSSCDNRKRGHSST